MSVRQYSLRNPVAWTNGQTGGGGPIAVAGFCATENKSIASGILATIQSRFSLGLRGASCWEGPIAFGTF